MGSCAFRSSLDSQNDWGRVEFESHHRSSDFDQRIEDNKDLRQNDSKKPFSVNHFFASKNIPVAPQPPYSPDLCPCDFFLFPKLKNHLKGHHFGTLEIIQTAVTDQLKAIPISEFHQCYEEWKIRLQRCVASEGSYSEGDNIELYVYWNKQEKRNRSHYLIYTPRICEVLAISLIIISHSKVLRTTPELVPNSLKFFTTQHGFNLTCSSPHCSTRPIFIQDMEYLT
ncbi:uncharacterized protein TNCV_4686121 [Trichonephila clavipes]|nr:uncharacterized protein TNCV_4686121 [Trichonephila clavipes]